MDIDTIGAQILDSEIVTKFQGGTLNGATKTMRLGVVIPAAAARAIEVFTRHPETGEKIDSVAYQIKAVSPCDDDEGVSLDPDDEPETRVVWVHAGPLDTIL